MVQNGLKHKNMAHFNNKLVINMLLQEPLSCMELAWKTNLTHMATGRILKRLLEMDIIKHYVDTSVKKTRGRQFCRYEINSERAYFVCLNFHHFNESFSIYDLSGHLLYKEPFETNFVDGKAMNRIIKRIRDAFSEKKLPIERLATVSVSIPGRINSRSGEIIISSKIDNSVKLKKCISSAFPLSSVIIKNDIDFACIYSILSNEFDYSEGSHLYLYIGPGSACCAVYKKEIICGENGFCGEIGMNCIDGSENKLHSVIGTDVMLEFCRKITGNKNLSLSGLGSVCENYPDIKTRLVNIAETLGRAIRNYVDILGVYHIIFAGEITKYPPFFFDVFTKTLKQAYYSESIDYRIDFSNSGETDDGQMLLSRLDSLDWVMIQY